MAKMRAYQEDYCIREATYAIRRDRKDSGEVQCPSCYGNLKYEVSSFNGEIHAHCEDCDLEFRK